MKNKRIPRYQILRIYFFAIILHVLLVLPVFSILYLKNDPTILTAGKKPKDIVKEANNSALQNTKSQKNITINLGSNNTEIKADNKRDDKRLDEINKLTFNTLLAVISFIFLLNLPFKIYFARKRNNKIIAQRLLNFCRKLLLKIPVINSAIFLFAFIIIHAYMIIILQNKSNFADRISHDLYASYLYISLFSSTLIVIFVYLWQKHRMNIRYLEHVFHPDELRVKIFKSKVGGIRNRLWISIALTTLLPLTVVIFYLTISLTSLKDFGSLSADQTKIAFGQYYQGLVDIGIVSPQGLNSSWYYINAFDNVLLLFGISAAIFVSLIYLAIFLRWTTNDIVLPVKELLFFMKRIGEGKMDGQAIVRTNDEIGELTAGYNQMTSELNNYISKISRLNEAYLRFVPREFIEELNRKDIMQIELGDQVQREMTILFTDIRDFTELSEEMNPKENFDFINQYLGIMEPIISSNNGFIDKYIGDSIMALFRKGADDALLATLEMRRVLIDFNELRESEGKSPIEFGTGIHTGNMMLGIVGGYGRMDGTVISDAVNLASRLEGLSKYYGASVIISEDTLIKLSNPSMFNYRFLDIAKVKGKKQAVYIFELIDAEPEPSRSKKIETKSTFVKAAEYYRNQDFEAALDLFLAVQKIHPTDKAANLYIKRCQHIIKNGLPEDWNSTEIFNFK